jgi:hypothetical protein
LVAAKLVNPEIGRDSEQVGARVFHAAAITMQIAPSYGTEPSKQGFL